MAEAKKTPDPKPAASTPPADLAPAGQSGDPDVQKLLAEREIHRQNLDPDPNFEQQRDKAQASIDKIDAKLKELGYAAY